MEQAQTYSAKAIELLMAYLPKIVMALLVLLIGLWIIGSIAKLMERLMAKSHTDVSLRSFLISLVKIGLRVLLIISVAGMAGIETTSFVAILGAAGLAVGLALQGSLANFAGGVLILIFRPFKVGDVIEAQGKVGEVKEIQIFSTLLATPDGKTVIVPNGPLSNGIITNVNTRNLLAVSVKVEIGSQYSMAAVREVALPLMTSDPRVLKDPAPAVGIAQLKPGAIVVELACFATPADQPAVAGDLTEKVLVAFAQHGFNPPESHTFVHSA
jgi:small conductance mechanosensitive channel